jgi:hypothetical protein
MHGTVRADQPQRSIYTARGMCKTKRHRGMRKTKRHRGMRKTKRHRTLCDSNRGCIVRAGQIKRPIDTGVCRSQDEDCVETSCRGYRSRLAEIKWLTAHRIQPYTRRRARPNHYAICNVGTVCSGQFKRMFHTTRVIIEKKSCVQTLCGPLGVQFVLVISI